MNTNSPRSWREILLVYSTPRVIAMAFLGFSGGLPFLLVFSTLTAWLADADVAKGTIGFFAWVGVTWSIKVLWAPVIDTLPVPLLSRVFGQRRAWMLVGQTGIILGLVGMAWAGPGSLFLLSLFALLVAFSSATQDVAIDAWRIEAADEEYQGVMSASYVFGYRLALLAAGAGALYLAAYLDWPSAYHVMAMLMGVGVVTVLLVAEPHRPDSAGSDYTLGLASFAKAFFYLLGCFFSLAVGFVLLTLGFLPFAIAAFILALVLLLYVAFLVLSRLGILASWFGHAVIGPFAEFFVRNGSLALIILLFIAVFRLSDITMGIMANPFYLDMGYSKTDIANVSKIYGFFMTILGSFLCGTLVLKWGVMRPLLIGAIAVSLTNLLFVALAGLPPDLTWLAVVISADNISAGFAATAFIAYLSGLTNRAYTATQYALFSSLMTLPGKFISGFSGLVVEGYGYAVFFSVAAALGIPAILLVLWLTRLRHQA